MTALLNLTGQRFGRLVVQHRSPNVGNNTMWMCLCDCGTSKAVASKHLVSRKTTSCSCYSVEHKIARQTKHGDTPFNQPNSAEYRIWRHIKSRCFNPNVPGFENYGGRGITVCETWRNDYSTFLRDMGRRPSRLHSIERIDVNGDYEPGNCVWATAVTQSRNRRCIRMTLANAEQIRAKAANGVPRKALQEEYGVSRTVVGLLIRGKTWRADHV